MGLVRWENGAPAPNAVVFMQHAYDFRKYVRRVECDGTGFFRFSGVHGDAPYFLFALPPGNSDAMRLFDHFGVGNLTREVWRELTLHPHRVTGAVPAPPEPRRASTGRTGRLPQKKNSESSAAGIHDDAELHLARLENGKERIVWTFRAGSSGKFTVANIPHGRYRVRAVQAAAKTDHYSLALDVGDAQFETAVRWSHSRD